MNPRKLAKLLILFHFGESFRRHTTVNPTHIEIFNLMGLGLSILAGQCQDVYIVSATSEATLFGNNLDYGVLCVMNVDDRFWLALLF